MKLTENYRRPSVEVYEIELEAGFAQSGGGVLDDYSESSDQIGYEWGGSDDQFE